jgi:hypothetical protein
MAIIVHADGREDWIEEQYRVTCVERDFDGSDIERTRQTVEVDAYSNFTAIDVAIDKYNVCSPDRVKDLKWIVINVADEMAATA